MLSKFFWRWILKDCVEVQEKKKIFVILCSVLHKTRNLAFSSLSRAVKTKKCTKGHDTRAELLFYPSFSSSNVGNFFWSWILKDRIKFRKRKRKSLSWAHVLHKTWNYYFHIVVVQWRQRNKCTKRHDARAKLLFCQSNPFAFFPFSLTSMKSLFKLPNKCHFMKEGKSENTMVTLTKFWRVYHSQSMKRGGTAFFTAFMILEGVTKGAGNTAGKLVREERVLLPFAFSHALFSSHPHPPFILNARKEYQ